MEWDETVLRMNAIGLVPVASCHPASKITDKWMMRKYARNPKSMWRPFHPYAVVEVRNCFNEPAFGAAHEFDWRWETDIGLVRETVIMKARQIFRGGKPLFKVPAKTFNPRHLPVVIYERVQGTGMGEASGASKPLPN